VLPAAIARDAAGFIKIKAERAAVLKINRIGKESFFIEKRVSGKNESRNRILQPVSKTAHIRAWKL